MLKQKTYSCGICKSKGDQLSHHKSHLESVKHKDKTELFQLKLSKLSLEELLEKYNSSDIEVIIDALVNTAYEYKDSKTEIKKLNSETIEQEDNINTSENTSDLTPEAMAAQNTTDTITNKEALKDKIHELNNYLRNNGAGIGMNGLKVFNILFGLKKLEEKNLFEKANLKVPDAKFSYLLELANKNTSETNEILAHQITKLALDAIYKSKINDLLMYEIPKQIKGSVFSHLIKEIDNITKIEKQCNVLLSGKIYEYFIGRDETAISELGAYFTDTHITDYIYYKKLNPTINEDGTIGTMIDMFGGAGGFTTGYINYLIFTYNKESIPIEKHIKWDNELKKIFHFDINQDVIKSAGLEFFCLTGTLPDMKNNLCYANSFVDSNNIFKDTKYKYVVTNPPYGGDKNKESDAQVKRIKIKEYIKKILVSITDEDKKAKLSIQLKELEKAEKVEKKEFEKNKVSVDMSSDRIKRFSKKYSLKGNDKESVSLMLIMDTVDLGGTAIGVLKEGVFFNKAYKDLRKCLVENFNVREIISVPQDQFENTSTKTSIVIFDNLENIKTTEVKFYDLVVERYTEDKFIEDRDGKILLSENKDDIKGISDKLISSATRDEILNNPIVSLNGKDYNKKEIVCGEGYELVKLGDICKLENGKQLDKKNIVSGQYPVYGGGLHPVGYHNAYNNENCTIIAGTGNCGFVQFDKNKFWASQCFTLKSNNDLMNKYLFIICKSMENIFMNSSGGSVQKFIRAKQFIDMLIPIPKTPEKIAEWVEKISKPYDEKNTKQAKIQELEKLIQSTIKNITENEECDEVELGSICDINPESLKKHQYTYINYIDISSVKEGTINNIQLLKDSLPSRAQRIIRKNDILFSTVRPNLKGYTFINETIENGVATSGFAVIRNKYNNINSLYIYYLLTNNSITEYLIKKSTGTNYPAVKPDVFNKIKIKIPKNKKLIEDMESLFKEIETLQNDVKKAEELYKQLIKELSQEAIPNQPIITNTGTTLNDILNSSDNEEQEDNSVTTLNDVVNTSDNEEQEEVIETPVIKQPKQPKQTKSIIIKKKKE